MRKFVVSLLMASVSYSPLIAQTKRVDDPQSVVPRVVIVTGALGTAPRSIDSSNPLPIACLVGCNGSGSNPSPSSGTIGTTAPTYASQVGGYDSSGKLQAISVNSSGQLTVNLAGTVPLATNASTASNQVSQTTVLNTINTTLGQPLQQGGTIGNTGFAINGSLPAGNNIIGSISNAYFGARLQDASGNPVGLSAGNPLYVQTNTASSLTVDQGSTTSGERGILNQGAVTSASPVYTSGQTSALSLTPSGALRVDGSNSTQPVSMTSAPLAANAATANNQNSEINNLSQIITNTNGVSTAAKQDTLNASINGVTTALGTPFQAGGSIANTQFGALQVGGWTVGVSSLPAISLATGTNTIGSIANTGFNITGTLPAFATTPTVNIGNSIPTGTNTIGSIANTGFAINGSLPAYATTPTFNLGTLNGAATSTLQTTINTSITAVNTTLGSPFQAGGSIGNTSFGAKLQDAGGNAFGTSGNPVVVSTLGGSVSTSQNSATSGQSGELVQGAVTTGSPVYTTGNTNPLSLTTAGALRTDSSSTTQPVTGTVTANLGTLNGAALAANQPGLATVGAASPTTGTQAMGTDGTNARALLTDSSGRLILGTPSGNQPVVGNVAAGSTDSGASVKTGAVYNSTAPTYTTGQRTDLQSGSRGALNVTLFGNNSVNTPSIGTIANGATTGFGLQVNNQNQISNGTTWDLLKDTNSTTGTIGTGLLGAGQLGWDATNSVYRRALVDINGNQMIAPVDSGSVTTTPVSAVNGILFSVDTTGYGGIGFTLGGTWTGTLTAQVSDDNSTWLTASAATVGVAQSGFTTNGAGFIPAQHRYIRLLMTSYTSGTVTASATLRKDSANVLSGVTVNGGNIAVGATDSGSPIKIGGYASNSIPTAVTSGQRQNSWYGLNGQQIVSFAGIGVADGGSTSGPSALYDYSSTAGIRWLGTANQLWNGTTWNNGRSVTGSDSTGLGVAAVAATPNSSAGAGAAATTVAAATVNSLKATAGNVYSLNVANGTTTGFVILYNAAAAPTSGTTLTTANVEYCMALAPSATLRDTLAIPLYFNAGIQLLFSTSCTTYTATATAPVLLIGQVK